MQTLHKYLTIIEMIPLILDYFPSELLRSNSDEVILSKLLSKAHASLEKSRVLELKEI